jgi:signal transduction histidine kinase
LLRECAAEVAPDIEIAGSGPSVWPLDRGRMRQVLVNLLDNAHKTGARVEASVEGRNGALVFAVRDHGPGIAKEELEQIFEPFHTDRTRGTGLGLAIARRFVELHGGTIAARNAPGGGAEFLIEIPEN